jgi:hypothetical protein
MFLKEIFNFQLIIKFTTVYKKNAVSLDFKLLLVSRQKFKNWRCKLALNVNASKISDLLLLQFYLNKKPIHYSSPLHIYKDAFVEFLTTFPEVLLCKTTINRRTLPEYQCRT